MAVTHELVWEVRHPRVKNTRTVLALSLELGMAVGIVIFWTLFFTGVTTVPRDPLLQRAYLAYERAFPAADFALTLGLCLSAFTRIRRMKLARTMQPACGGAAAFLGILDISFNLQNRMYGLDDGIPSLIMNLCCVVIGVALVGLSSGMSRGSHIGM